ncbi:trypsin-5-like isoform X2 [Nymphalis io]|uniref:trypsin-5-like isoform X2 n=1 Tax=Inachis io TaxID=171585 RepID=UPI002167AED9|nr:trypsin-5-like isoform X2 [Nymphalis io]
MWRIGLLLIVTLIQAQGKQDSENTEESDDREDSGERIGPAITQIFKHPYTASLLKNDSYVCSAVILNTYWLLTLSKCFETDITSYVTHRNLENYKIRTGSSYNNKGGSISKIKMLINNFDLKVSAVKLEVQLVFGPKVDAVRLPSPDDDVSLGLLATILAWTPTGHLRVVNAPVISSAICEPSALWSSDRYICLGGVQDPNRHFCRKDNGGAVIQNNTLIAIASFLHTCALYTKTHAFPKISTFSRWLDTVIWDESNRPTTAVLSTTIRTTQLVQNTTEIVDNKLYADPRKYLVTLPFDPINVPLEPAEDNSVIPRMSLYESYLQNLAKLKTSTTIDPNVLEDEKKEWLRKFANINKEIKQRTLGFPNLILSCEITNVSTSYKCKKRTSI